jgi:hypothetical protein
MPKTAFVVTCSDDQRKEFPAKYKIAAEWIGGGYTELKTFGFADDECLERVFHHAQQRANRIRLSEGESISQMRVYQLDTETQDQSLRRLEEVESRILAQAS